MRTACALVEAANDHDESAIDALVGGVWTGYDVAQLVAALVALFNDLRREVAEDVVKRLISEHRERSFVNDEDL